MSLREKLAAFSLGNLTYRWLLSRYYPQNLGTSVLIFEKGRGRSSPTLLLVKRLKKCKSLFTNLILLLLTKMHKLSKKTIPKICRIFVIFCLYLVIYNLAASLGVINLNALIDKIENGTQFLINFYPYFSILSMLLMLIMLFWCTHFWE